MTKKRLSPKRKLNNMVKQRQPKIKNRRKPSRRSGVVNPRRTSVPLARGGALQMQFQTHSIGKQKMRVSCIDVPYSALSATEFDGKSLICLIHCNPNTWPGTRVQVVSDGYQNWRPIRFRLRYVPMVPATTQGQVIIGTFFRQPPTFEGYGQSLLNSNGGGMCTVWQPMVTEVAIEGHMPQKLFNTKGNITQDEVNPFTVAVMASGYEGKYLPGLVYVDCEFEFVNGVGTSGPSVTTAVDVVPDPVNLGNEVIGWGISILKAALLPVLAHGAVTLLNWTRDWVTQKYIPAGSSFVMPDTNQRYSLMMQSMLLGNPVIPVLSADGTVFYIPEDTRVISFQNGPSKTHNNGPGPQPSIEYNDFPVNAVPSTAPFRSTLISMINSTMQKLRQDPSLHIDGEIEPEGVNQVNESQAMMLSAGGTNRAPGRFRTFIQSGGTLPSGSRSMIYSVWLHMVLADGSSPFTYTVPATTVTTMNGQAIAIEPTPLEVPASPGYIWHNLFAVVYFVPPSAPPMLAENATFMRSVDDVTI